MLAIVFGIFYVAINIIIAYIIYGWIKSIGSAAETNLAKRILAVVYFGFAALIFAAFLPKSGIKSMLCKLSNYHLGVLINIILVFICALIVKLVTEGLRLVPKGWYKERRHKLVCGIICAVLAVGWSLYGFINAHYMRTTEYDVDINKLGDNMKIVLIADMHLGYSLGSKQMERMAEKINAMDADLICIAGDIYDNDYDALDDPNRIEDALASMQSTYGTYACWGNHDISDKLFGGFTLNNHGEKKHDSRMEELLNRAGIRLLEDESVVIDNKLTLIGRLDKHKPGTDDGTRMAITDFEFDTSKPVIVLEHEPAELEALVSAGVDLDINGHTHNGQVFPGTLTIKLFWENPAGYITKVSENGHIMHSIVTEGVGVYGPYMRTGCKSEIVEINVDL